MVRRPPAYRRSTLGAIALVQALASCSHEAARMTSPPPPRTFDGTYALMAIDGLALPQTIVTGLTGASMHVEQGRLVFDGSSLLLQITGPLNGGGNAVTLGTGGTYTVVGADSLQSGGGVSGRVWADSANIGTLSFTLAGAHRLRFVRAP